MTDRPIKNPAKQTEGGMASERRKSILRAIKEITPLSHKNYNWGQRMPRMPSKFKL